MEPLSISLPFAMEAVLFDLDDTLYDRDRAYYNWACAFVKKHFSTASTSHEQEITNTLVLLDNHEDTPRDILFAQFQQHYPMLNISVSALVEEYYQEFPHYIEPMEEMYELLNALREANIPFGVITNGSSRQLRKIEILGLGQLTSCIFVSKLFGKEKPDSAIFLAAAAHLQVPPDKVLFVGDNPYNDIWGAHCTGMRTVWLQRTHPWPLTLSTDLADITLRSFKDLLITMRVS